MIITNSGCVGDVLLGDCVEIMKSFGDESVDLTVTSPPYDNLRTYNGYSFNFESIALELFRITKPGGVVVWVVGDATVNGSETGTSFRQALFFKDECGFNLHDTMIYQKNHVFAYDPRNGRYKQAFEFMFVLSKGRPSTYNPIADVESKKTESKSITGGRSASGKLREAKDVQHKQFQDRPNVWRYGTGMNQSTKDREAFKHPAIFPEGLACDHIISWSNPGDLIFDPFTGSGTTGKMALIENRNFIGCEISEDYLKIAESRIHKALSC